MKHKLFELAQQHIEKMRHRDYSLEKEQQELEQRLNEIKTERNNFIEKFSRFKTYEPSLDVCPACWINNGSSIKFKPMPGNNVFDKFKCSHCGTSLKIPI